MQVPKSKKKTRIHLSKSGEVITRTGKFTSHHKLYPSVKVVTNPKRILDDARKMGAEQVFVSIKGHRGKTGYNLKTFERYLAKTIVPDIESLLDEEEDIYEEAGLPSGRTKRSAFRNWFGVEFISYDWKPTKEKRSRKNRRR